MDQKQFFDHLRALYDNNIAVVRAKNHDYAASHDPFWNFRLCEHFGLCSVEVGILVRILDKIGRIINLINFAPAVKDETIHDAIGDAQNYLGILDAYLTDQKATEEVINRVDPTLDNAAAIAEALRERGISVKRVDGDDPIMDDVVSYFDPQIPTPGRYVFERSKQKGDE